MTTDILLIEDNAELSTLLKDFLTAEGYSVEVTDNGEDGLFYFEQNNVKLVILDIMLPKADGFTVCRKMRSDSDVPILIVSAKTEKDDKLTGIELGADDYIEKPYDIDILLAKIKGIFKRRYEKDEIVDGNIRIDIKKRTAYINDEELSLSVKEYELLLLLIENKGKTLKKEWIFSKIWGMESFSELQTLTVHIKWLRQKIGDGTKYPERIKTVWGIGYRFE